MQALEAVLATKWAITEPWLATILEIAAREPRDLEAVEKMLGRPLDNAHAVTVRDGVAIIPIAGPIFRYANLFTKVSGATSVEMLARDFERSLSDPSIRGILLNIDSPGGAVGGINEFAQQVYDARGRKPITAYVGDLGASAAYWIASAADQIVVDPTAYVGSIGVIATLRGKDPKENSFVFVSSNSPKKRLEPGTVAGDAEIQTLVDAVGDEFVGVVARNRGVSIETVLADFGQGGVLAGRKAVTANVADRLGSFEQVLSELAKPPAVIRSAARAAIVGDSGMSLKSMFKDMFGAMQELEAEQPQAEEGTWLTATTETPAEPAPDAGTAAQLAAAQAELKRHQEAAQQRITADATLFVDAAIKTELILPADRDRVLAAYVQAAQDDQQQPPADPANSRLAFVTWSIQQRTPHGLTREFLPQGQDAQALINRATTPGAAEQPMSEERRQALHKLTPLGREVVANENGRAN